MFLLSARKNHNRTTTSTTFVYWRTKFILTVSGVPIIFCLTSFTMCATTIENIFCTDSGRKQKQYVYKFMYNSANWFEMSVKSSWYFQKVVKMFKVNPSTYARPLHSPSIQPPARPMCLFKRIQNKCACRAVFTNICNDVDLYKPNKILLCALLSILA